MTVADVVDTVLAVLAWAVLAYFLVVNGALSALLVAAAGELRAHRLAVWRENRWRVLSSEVAPTISVLAPAHDEAATIAENVRSLLTLRYPTLEVVVIDDGSQDATLEVLMREFALVPVHAAPVRRRLAGAPVTALYRSSRTPSLVVAAKENGGKADALNAGLDVAEGELVCAIDADTVVEADALQRMVRPFLTDPGVIAAGGTLHAVNGSTVRGGRVVHKRAPHRLLPALQAVEYMRAFLCGRLGWNRLGGNLIVSGAFGLFRREHVVAAGGYLNETVGEDMELVVRMRRLARERGEPDRVPFVPDPIAWTEVPSRARVLARQRDRWHRGLADVLVRHRRMLLDRRYGALGLVGMPYFVFIELLAPLIEALGLLVVLAGLLAGVLDVQFAVLFLLVAYGCGLLLTVVTFTLDEWTFRSYGPARSRAWLLFVALLEGLGYRQATALWRVRGLWRFLRGRRDWGSMPREGFAPPPPTPRRDRISA